MQEKNNEWSNSTEGSILITLIISVSSFYQFILFGLVHTASGSQMAKFRLTLFMDIPLKDLCLKKKKTKEISKIIFVLSLFSA